MIRKIIERFKAREFHTSGAYWENRYRQGGDSGSGSYGELAKFKAEIINKIVADHDIKTVQEFGCGDGNQLKLASYPKYIGYDISESAIARCRRAFSSDRSKRFVLLSESAEPVMSDIVLSLDVIFHLVEESVYIKYMNTIFDYADRFVLIYSSNYERESPKDAPHLKHRMFSRWIDENRPGWRLKETTINRYPYEKYGEKGSFSDFFLYEKVPQSF